MGSSPKKSFEEKRLTPDISLSRCMPSHVQNFMGERDLLRNIASAGFEITPNFKCARPDFSEMTLRAHGKKKTIAANGMADKKTFEPKKRIRMILMASCAIILPLMPVRAHADCTTSGTTETCTGDLTSPILRSVTGTGGTTVYSLKIEDVTSDSIAVSSSDSSAIAAVGFVGESIDSLLGGPNLSLDLDLGVDSDDFTIEATEQSVGFGVLMLTEGSDGDSPGENRGTGNRTGGTGGTGGTAGDAYLEVSGTTILSSDSTVAITASAGTGGHGAEAFSDSGGDGHGGWGGDGGFGGVITASLEDVVLNISDETLQPTVNLDSSGGDAGDGGTSKAAAYLSRAGTGGTGGEGGTSTVDFTGTVTIDPGQAGSSGVVIDSSGGDGGHGGYAFNFGLADADGGVGGTGGEGGDVVFSARTDSDVTISTEDAVGVLLNSIAGDGGDGGDAENNDGDANGGDGGSGGSGGTIDVDLSDANSITLETSGNDAVALFARSYGGAGGDGGEGSSFIGSGGGGDGAGSGIGGAVTVEMNGAISTSGDESDAILVQSVGGFSGNGGSASGIVAYGASSESAGAGGKVQVTLDDGTYTTDGAHSDVIFAQSIGGGGGSGASSSGISSLAGSGSAGGAGGEVIVDANLDTWIDEPNIQSTGERARGIIAQSIGGGGGDGGSASGIYSVGGSGSLGGTGGSVNVIVGSNTYLSTDGDHSEAVLAQSIGGGGGSASSKSTSGVYAVGGSGGIGATGGDVTVSAGAEVSTSGDHSDGIFAQSVGGSGGKGSNSLGIGLEFSVAIGGDGGIGGHGGDVEVTDWDYNYFEYTVATEGDFSSGVVAQSVGGGGGHAGNAVSTSVGIGASVSVANGGTGGGAGDGGDSSVIYRGAITTGGDHAMGIVANSVGGSGGTAGTTVAASASAGFLSLSTAVGGDGGGGGDGGTVNVCRAFQSTYSNGCVKTSETYNSKESITTTGDASHGILASSVGGGGGHSGTTVAGSLIAVTSVDVGVGGDGGEGGAGGEVFVTSDGGISTSGDTSNGILAKSIGGTGGASYATISGSAVSMSGAVSVSVGGSGGSAKGGGDVFVIADDSTISTAGAVSTAIKALSIGGSGGIGGAAVSADILSTTGVGVALGGDGGSGGAGGDVTVSTKSNIVTEGDLSDGVLALSSGGSGGAGGFTASGGGANIGAVNVSLGGAGGEGGEGGTVTLISEGDSITTGGTLGFGLAAASIGGSGGKGGGALSATLISAGDVNVTLGGSGGVGGSAGSVSLVNESSITTTGTQSTGIAAQSIGGNGGAGGFAAQTGINASLDPEIPAGSVTVTIGGDGGEGGNANTVVVDNAGAIATNDFGSIGILAQSIGGGGGAGGTAYSGTANVGTEGTTLDVNVTIGGAGGTGGEASTVTVTNATGTSISTVGDASQGILAQSIGGNGGAGGNAYNVLANIESQSESAVNITVTVGGEGGFGALGEKVVIENAGDVTTEGAGSAGLYAQSIGGNGGNGGSGGNILFQTAFSDGEDDEDGEEEGSEEEDSSEEEGEGSESSVNLSMNFAVGGSAGTGAVAGEVTLEHGVGGTITTSGTNSHGIFAQSVGGGGGDGGGASNYGLDVSGLCDFSVVNQNSTACDDEDGEEDSDDSEDTDTDDSSETEFSLNAQFGGSGGTGGHGNTVLVLKEGAVVTNGDSSHAIYAQSVGGGGGAGGNASPSFDSFTTNQTADDIDDAYGNATDDSPYEKITNWSDFNLSIGGSGGAGGDGGTVTVFHYGAASTTGNASYGIFAQSVGGGGGASGSASGEDNHSLTIGGSGGAAGDGGTVDLVSIGESSISTSGQRTVGIFAQSVGGGGGSTDVDPGVDLSDIQSDIQFSFTVGGQEGASGDGGVVSISNTSTTITTGDLYSPGIFAQSVGGGGGAVMGGVDNATGDTTVGGGGFSIGDGGSVSVTHSGSISTGANLSSPDVDANAGFGIFAQSVGGGGGYAGAVTFGASSYFGNDLIGMSGDPFTTGDGGNVSVSASGNVSTVGGGSVGIFAQSVGGGGGVAGMSDRSNTTNPTVYIGNGGGFGTGGAVTVDYSDGTILTTGKAAHGIFAQSAGGPSSTTTTDTMVSVTVGGDINVTGHGSHGIFAQSVGDGMGKIAVEIAEGATVSGGKAAYFDDAEDGAGVFIKNGTDENTLINNGTITSTLGSDGVAINVKDTTVTVTNNGTIVGDWLKASEIYAVNSEGANIQAGEVFMVDKITNHGEFAVGHANVVSHSNVEGHFTQSETGKLVITLNPAASEPIMRTDNLHIGGDADLSGTVEIQMAEDWGAGYGVSKSQFLTVAGSSNLSNLTLKPSVAGQYDLLTADDGTSHLHYHIHFANEDILAASNANQRRIAEVIHALYVDPDFMDEDYSALLAIETAEEYATSMSTFGAEVLSHAQIASLTASQRFRDDLLSCPQRDGNLRFLDQGQCTWYRLGGQRTEQDSTSETLGFTETSWRFAAGAQTRFENDWILGGGLSYETTQLSTPDADAASDGKRYQFGLTLKRQIGAVELATAVSAGKTENDITRNPTIGGTATGQQDIWSYGGHIQLSTLIEGDDWYVIPRLGLGVEHQSVDDYTETGGTYALAHDQREDTNVHVHLGADFGSEYTTQSGMLIRPKLSLGVIHFLTDPSPIATAGFVDSNISNFSFNSGSSLDRTRLDIVSGLDMFMSERTALRVEFGGSLSENSMSIGGQVKLSIDF